MRKLVALGAISIGLLVTSCTTTKPLYYWGDYENLAYKVVKGNEQQDVDALMASYNEIVNGTAKGTSGKVPPGVCADLGFFLMRQGKVEEGKKWLMREKEIYPESSIFVDRILTLAEK
jgi:hypothetical protein